MKAYIYTLTTYKYTRKYVAMKNLTTQLIRVWDVYISQQQSTGRRCASATLSTKLFSSGRRMDQLRSGSSSLTTAKWEYAMQWLSDNWPDGAKWPDGIDRPAPAQALEQSENSQEEGVDG